MTYAEWAALVATPVTTTLAIFALLVVRSTKVSEFRQAWINDQRNDLATVFALIRRLARGDYPDRDKDLLALDTAADRIRLRKNPKKKEWQNVLPVIAALRAQVAAVPPVGVNVSNRIEAAISDSRTWLKRDWNRVRFGEPVVRVLVILAGSLVLITIYPQIGEWLGAIWNTFRGKLALGAG